MQLDTDDAMSRGMGARVGCGEFAEATALTGGAELVTKTDMQIAPGDLEQRLTIKIGSMLIVAVDILAARRFFPTVHP